MDISPPSSNTPLTLCLQFFVGTFSFGLFNNDTVAVEHVKHARIFGPQHDTVQAQPTPRQQKPTWQQPRTTTTSVMHQ